MGLTGPGEPDRAAVLLGSDPLQGGEVVEGGLGNLREAHLERVQVLADREPGQL